MRDGSVRVISYNVVMEPKGNSTPSPVVTDHRRQWRKCLYGYPVISRRSGGVSIGVNLNIDKRCAFSCVYCRINRRMRRADKGGAIK